MASESTGEREDAAENGERVLEGFRISGEPLDSQDVKVSTSCIDVIKAPSRKRPEGVESEVYQPLAHDERGGVDALFSYLLQPVSSLRQDPSRCMQDFLYSFLPCLTWLPVLSKDEVSSDLLAGVTVGVMMIPQSMAYAMIAGLPDVYGLYAGWTLLNRSLWL